MAEVEDDNAVLQTVARTKASDTDRPEPDNISDSEDDVEMANDNDDPEVLGDKAVKLVTVQNSRGLTHPCGGAPLKTKVKDGKPKHYPPYWGDSPTRSQIMKKRVMDCFDGFACW